MTEHYRHVDNGESQRCEQCGKLAPLSFTLCCGMLVCDDCQSNHDETDCIKEDEEEAR